MNTCSIDSCQRKIKFKERQICQMHYFRFMRNGTYDLIRKRKYRTQNPAGYQRIFEPAHPLANKDGYVYEHRFIIYNKYGINIPDCELCGKKTDWKTCHIDHKDDDVTNNDINNLRPVCRYCNTSRGRLPEVEYAKYKITWNGITGTPSFWSQQPYVKIESWTIRQRILRGLSVEEALFMPKKTHINDKIKSKKGELMI